MPVNSNNRTTWAVAILAAAVTVLVGLGQVWATLEAPRLARRLQHESKAPLQPAQPEAPSVTTEQLKESDDLDKANTVDSERRTATDSDIALEGEPIEGGEDLAFQKDGVLTIPEAPERAETTSPETLAFMNGQQAVCGSLRIDAEPWYDPSLGDYGKVRITLPDGTRRDHRIHGSTPTQIVPGCIVVSARIRYQRSDQPYAELTIMEEAIR